MKPGETPPVESVYAKAHTQAGALAFAAYFIRAIDWSIATNDPYLIEQTSSPSCQACRNYISAILSVVAKNGQISGGRLQLKSAVIDTGISKIKSDFVVRMQLAQSPARTELPSATPSTAKGDDDVKSYLFVSWFSTSWRVVEQGN